MCQMGRCHKGACPNYFVKNNVKMTFRGGQDTLRFKNTDWAPSVSTWKTSDIMGGEVGGKT